MDLNKMFRWCYPKVAITNFMNMNKITQPNASIDLGILHSNMGTLPQLKMLSPQAGIVNGVDPDTSYASHTGKGEIYIPAYKDFYIGEGEGGI